MFPEYDKEEKKIKEEIAHMFGSEQDTSTLGVSMVTANEAQAILIRLNNPVITTHEHTVIIHGKVFATSLLETKKVVQGRQTTPGINRFPKIVDDMLKTGSSSELSRLGRIDMREANIEIKNLQLIYTSNNLSKKIAFLTEVNPITPITEYTIDGKHTSGIALKPQDVPLIIKAEKAYLEYTSSSGVKVSDLRIEKHSSNDLIGPKFIIESVQNNISEKREHGRELLGDIITIISGIMIAFGIAFSIVGRGRLIEAGLPLLILGCIIFYVRHFTNVREYFSPSEIEIMGEAPMEMRFIGELE